MHDVMDHLASEVATGSKRNRCIIALPGHYHGSVEYVGMRVLRGDWKGAYFTCSAWVPGKKIYLGERLWDMAHDVFPGFHLMCGGLAIQFVRPDLVRVILYHD